MPPRKGDPRFFFEDKDSPDYKPKYGSTYTERQMGILCGRIPLDEVHTAELGILYRKAEQMEDIDSYETAKMLYDLKINPNGYRPPYSLEEAKAILQSMVPWEIDWRQGP